MSSCQWGFGLILTGAVVMSGCATQASLVVGSEPEGAYISEIDTGTSLGMAPVVARYDAEALGKAKSPEGCFLVKGFEARWVSGAVSTSEPVVKLCGSNVGTYEITINRDVTHLL
jgi:hypothetical protein